ncbi:hypothetical protein [uncultured Bradyrhizobium sp.]|uniref:hypothetical protein n=1 Tax=uncultured Bradyrhizobium sp. TaxID=199684 RepID=UPI00261BDF36|nr:hypothetical protein [uncultured Bradyrhizobium sp.]
MDDLEIGRTDRDRIDAHQHLGARRRRRWLVAKVELIRVTKDPGFHQVGDGKIGRCLDAGRLIHGRFLFCLIA